MAKSKALTDFESSLNAAEALMDIEKQLPNPPRKADQPKASGLRGGAAVLMVASFEAFLKSAVVEHLTRLATHPPRVPFDRLPEKMRLKSVLTCLDTAINDLPHKAKKRIDRLPDIKKACSRVAADMLDPEALSATRSNPSSGTVKELFGDLGIPDVFGVIHAKFVRKWQKPEIATFISDKLDEIVQRRHRVAHTGSALDITRSQLKEALKFLRVLALLLDAQIRSHIESL